MSLKIYFQRTPFQRATTRLFLTTFTFNVILRSWRTLTLLTSWPWNLVCFIWLSKDYLVIKLRLSISGRCPQLNFLRKKLLGDLDLELWCWRKNESSVIHIYLCPIYHLQCGLSEQKGKVSKVSEKSLHNFKKIGKNVVFLRDIVRLGRPLLQFEKFFLIWNLDVKTFSMSYYTTIFSKLDFQGRFKVMANFDLDDVMTLKPSIFYLAIQGLPCTLITTLYLW